MFMITDKAMTFLILWCILVPFVKVHHSKASQYSLKLGCSFVRECYVFNEDHKFGAAFLLPVIVNVRVRFPFKLGFFKFTILFIAYNQIIVRK